nr:MAG TPA: YycJ-like MBL-fold protein [Caudoviricetes sp.]
MKLKILGSSSTGNCYLFQTIDNKTLIVECGVDIKEIKKALNFDLTDVIGCLITHEHGDHSKNIQKVLDAGIDCYMSEGTRKALNIEHHRLHVLPKLERTRIGSFTIMAFKTKHDCADPIGFLIYHLEMGLCLFATDTYYVEYTFENLNNILIECNYAKDILNKNVSDGIINKMLRDRTLKSHFELENVKGFMKANNLSGVRNILLLHLSDRNSGAGRFKKEIEDLTGIKTTIADKGVEIDLSLYPF